MNASYDKNAAIVALPPVTASLLEDRSLQVWLAQADWTPRTETTETLARIVHELELPYPESGLAALRMWGQTGDRPTKWIAAADPVYLEPRLDHLCLHAMRRESITSAELRTLIDYLQKTLADNDQFGFTRLGAYGYLSACEPIATATRPAYVVDGDKPDNFLPSGEGTASYKNLVSEIEMALHEHAVNTRREARGQRPINSLWLWGGGVAAEQIVRPQPPLFSDDALLTGYWYSATGVAEPWLGTIQGCLDGSIAGFVASIPEQKEDVEQVRNCLVALRAALRSGRLSSVTLLFRGGSRAIVRRAHALRVWRRHSAILEDIAAS